MSEKNMPDKPWSGRFHEPTDAFVEAFTASVDFDQRLYRYDIAGSIAHARMLAHCGIITQPERDAIVQGLEDQGPTQDGRARGIHLENLPQD